MPLKPLVFAVAVAFACTTSLVGELPPQAAAQQSCIIERVTYRIQGLQIVSWIMKPAREGRFPVVVWNHGARFAFARAPVISERTPCHPFVASNGWMLFFPVPRGYAGSEGPNPQAAFAQDPLAFLHARAADANAGVEWLKTRSDVDAACIVNMGWSQGAMTTLLVSGEHPSVYRATVIQAPTTSAGVNAMVGMPDVLGAARHIPTPILFQANTDDVDSFIEGNRVLVRELRRWVKSVEYHEYTDPSRHFVFEISEHPGFLYRPELFHVWGPDVANFIARIFAGCSR